ncbi:deacetylase [Lithospermum erythrorhizon]|uniref:Deacetylase n=1 Tax=Lithospermum erythrorhizon TaxID=34254 RepID=A0AAV3S105_LITER
MDSADQVVFEFMPFIKAYKSGRIERLFGTDFVPPTLNSENGVSSKDVVIDPQTGVSARVFIPTNKIKPGQNLPVLVYFHGGAFCLCSPFCAMYHSYLTTLVEKVNVIAVSVDYRLAPEHPLPAAYEDSWNALKYVASHSAGNGPESWLNDHADFERVFLAGDSAGANISHNITLRAGIDGLMGMNINGVCIIHPDFVGREGSLNIAWNFICPDTCGESDTRVNPAIDPRLGNMGCSKMLVCVAEKDEFRDAGWIYYEAVKNSEWKGHVEITETTGEDHIFHLFNPANEKAAIFLDKVVSFISTGAQLKGLSSEVPASDVRKRERSSPEFKISV